MKVECKWFRLRPLDPPFRRKWFNCYGANWPFFDKSRRIVTRELRFNVRVWEREWHVCLSLYGSAPRG